MRANFLVQKQSAEMVLGLVKATEDAGTNITLLRVFLFVKNFFHFFSSLGDRARAAAAKLAAAVEAKVAAAATALAEQQKEEAAKVEKNDNDDVEEKKEEDATVTEVKTEEPKEDEKKEEEPVKMEEDAVKQEENTGKQKKIIWKHSFFCNIKYVIKYRWCKYYQWYLKKKLKFCSQHFFWKKKLLLDDSTTVKTEAGDSDAKVEPEANVIFFLLKKKVI